MGEFGRSLSPLGTRELRPFLSVTQLAEIVRGTLDRELGGFWVVGEISNFRTAPSGHFYFTLKDDKSQIAAVMFRRQGQTVLFRPENGMEVLCFGRVSLYPARGDLQLYVEAMEPRGRGALQLAFEQLRRRLKEEGLFDLERKRPLPFLPAAIGVVTSLQGAAVRDILRILENRYPDRRIVIRPVRVQGDGAALEIARAVRDISEVGVDVVIVGRGGGSTEDLWSFNEEVVARAIAHCPVPVISAVGHEVDFTIADFVADCRAPTPTAAAELAVPAKGELLAAVARLEDKLWRSMSAQVGGALERVGRLSRRLADPRRRLRERQVRVDELSLRLARCLRACMARAKERVRHAAGRLGGVSPLAVLERGYSIALSLPAERVIKDSAEVEAGERIRIRFARGSVVCRIEEKK